jgi:hypothetical protein
MTYPQIAGTAAVINLGIGLINSSPLNLAIAATVATVIWATRA